MAGEDKHSKTEQPTGKRLEDARKKGVPHSRDMTSTATLLAGIIALYTTGGFMLSMLQKTCSSQLATVGTLQLTEASVQSLLIKLSLTILVIIAPFMLIVVITGVLTTLVQVGFSVSSERITLSLDKLNPITNAQKLFSKDAGVEAFKAILKIIIVGYMAYRILRDEVPNIVYLAETDISGIIDFISHISLKIVVHTCGVMLILAVLDLAFVKWRFRESLMMTKQEVKQEMKESEGDPQVKGKIKQMQYAQARRRLRKVIPTADVVVTNPTHFAIALKYDRETMAAPVVLAKGADHLALRIKEIARESRVMLVENRFLARELYAQVKEGEQIPEALFAAVAEVLAYVYSLKGKI